MLITLYPMESLREEFTKALTDGANAAADAALPGNGQLFQINFVSPLPDDLELILYVTYAPSWMYAPSAEDAAAVADFIDSFDVQAWRAQASIDKHNKAVSDAILARSGSFDALSSLFAVVNALASSTTPSTEDLAKVAAVASDNAGGLSEWATGILPVE